MIRFLHDHSLGIVLSAGWLALLALAYAMNPDLTHGQVISDHAAGAFGGLVMVIASKYFIERGSSQSRQVD